MGQAELSLPFKSQQEKQPLFLSDLETWLSNPFKTATVLVESTQKKTSPAKPQPQTSQRDMSYVSGYLFKRVPESFPFRPLSPLFLVLSNASYKLIAENTQQWCVVSLIHSFGEKNFFSFSLKNKIELP